MAKSHPNSIPAARHERAGFALLLGFFLLSPLVFSRVTAETFEFPKLCLLLLVGLAFAALGLTHWMWRASGEGSVWRRLAAWRPGWVDVGVFLYVISAVASTVASVSPRTSLLGYHESHGGLPTVLGYTALYVAVRWLARSEADARRLLAGLLIGAAGAGVYAVLQVLRLDPVAWGQVSLVGTVVRPFSTVGHANFLAALMAMLLPAAGYFAWHAYRERHWPTLGLLIAVGGAMLFTLLACLSRGGWLAFGAAVLFLVIVAAARLRGMLSRPRQPLEEAQDAQGPRKHGTPTPIPPPEHSDGVAAARSGVRRVLIGAAGLVVLAGATLVLLRALPATASLFPKLGARLSKMADGRGRVPIWRASIEIFRAEPLLGCGLDCLAYRFGEHRTVEQVRDEWGVTPYRAHNEVLHTLATQGLLGGLALLVLTAGLVRAGWRSLCGPSADPLLWPTVCAGAVAFVVQVQVSFVELGCGVPFVLLAGLLARRERGGEAATVCDDPRWLSAGLGVGVVGGLAVFATAFVFDNSRPEASRDLPLVVVGASLLAMAAGLAWLERRRSFGAWAPPATEAMPATFGRPWWGWAMSGAAVLAAGWVAFVGVVQPYRASRHSYAGWELRQSDRRAALGRLERACALEPERELHWTRLGIVSLDESDWSPSPVESAKALRRAREAFERAVVCEPAQAHCHANLALALGRLSGERGSAERSMKAFEKAIDLDPVNPRFLIDAARTALLIGRPDRARKYATRAAKLYPDYGVPLGVLTFLDWGEGRRQGARETAERAVRANWRGDEAAFLDLVDLYAYMVFHNKQFDYATGIAEQAVAYNPSRIGPHLVLALVAEQNRDFARARREFQQVLYLAPYHDAARFGLMRIDVAEGH